MALPMSVEHLNLHYGSFHALKDVSLRMPAGQVTAFIGPSGCGKSTLLRCLNRMNDRIADCKVDGKVLLGDTDVYRDVDVYTLRRHVGMVFQKPNPFPISIFDNVTYALRMAGRSKRSELGEVVERTLTEVGLWNEVKDKLDHSGLSLSGGQAQRLCIARALAVDPDVLLMDEPTSALDPVSTGLVEELATQIAERHTVVIVTHNMQQATRISTTCAFFYLGELVEVAPTAQLFSDPKDKRTEDYLTGRFG
ncbi:MAG: phosphate ABC transporter ATP-binding protein PstB [Olsenella sp.]|nr:phosphate ABC transporter ATP-binding protein PstB [Olsenella sp.]